MDYPRQRLVQANTPGLLEGRPAPLCRRLGACISMSAGLEHWVRERCPPLPSPTPWPPSCGFPGVSPTPALTQGPVEEGVGQRVLTRAPSRHVAQLQPRPMTRSDLCVQSSRARSWIFSSRDSTSLISSKSGTQQRGRASHTNYKARFTKKSHGV